MKPIPLALAAVLIIVFGAAAYRIVSSCEPSSIEFLKKLKVDLKGSCPVPPPSPPSPIPSPATTAPTQNNPVTTTVTAPGGVAIGRDMTGGTINQGAPAAAEPSPPKSSTKAPAQ